jgi:Leucine-rich repeat (LRR) protein
MNIILLRFETNITFHFKEICGLDNCDKLKRLYLYDNAISKMKNLSMLKLLEVLWLNDNIIKSIEVHLIFLKCVLVFQRS